MDFCRLRRLYNNTCNNIMGIVSDEKINKYNSAVFICSMQLHCTVQVTKL